MTREATADTSVPVCIHYEPTAALLLGPLYACPGCREDVRQAVERERVRTERIRLASLGEVAEEGER